MRVFLINRPGINISQACLSELAGPQGVRSVEEAAEQDKWEVSLERGVRLGVKIFI